MKKIPVYDSLDDVIAAEDFGDVSAGSRTMIKTCRACLSRPSLAATDDIKDEAGVPAKVAQYLMGHATIQMTKDVYTDVQDSYIKTFDERVITFTDTQKRKD